MVPESGHRLQIRVITPVALATPVIGLCSPAKFLLAEMHLDPIASPEEGALTALQLALGAWLLTQALQ